MHEPHPVHSSLAQQLRQRLPRRPHVLLVLKDETYAAAISLWLSRLGWQVSRVSEASAALEAWRHSGAAVALVDFDDDGLGALALLAAAAAFRPLGRAVLCTRDRALAELPEDLRTRLGIEAVALRPCHVSQLGAAILRAAGLPLTVLSSSSGEPVEPVAVGAGDGDEEDRAEDGVASDLVDSGGSDAASLFWRGRETDAEETP